MKTEERPERIMAKMMRFRWSGGKLRVTFVEDQSSTKTEKTMRTGMERRLL